MEVQIPRCEKCERKLGLGLLTCQERSQGTCPYQVKHKSHVLGGLIFCTIVIFPAVYCWSKGINAFLFLLIPLSFGGLLAGGAWATTYTICANSTTGQLWLKVVQFFGLYRLETKESDHMGRRTVSLCGVMLSEYIHTAWEPIVLNMLLSHPLQFPASLAALCNYDEKETSSKQWKLFIADLFYGTLLHLLQYNVIQLKVARAAHHRILKPSRESYDFTLTLGETASVQIEGMLEHKLLETLNTQVPLRKNSILPLSTLPAIEVNALLQHLYHDCLRWKLRSGSASPSRELFTEMIAEEAQERGLGVLEKRGMRRKKHLTLPPHSREKLMKEYQVLQEIHEHFVASSPHIAHDFRKATITMMTQHEPSKYI